MKHLALVALMLASACGTTVPMTSQPAPNDLGVRGALLREQPPAIRGTLVPPAEGTSPSVGSATQHAVIGSDGPSAAAVPPSVSKPQARTPLKVGITYAETGSTARALGAQDGSVNGRTTAEALVRTLNARGGLRGRILQPVMYGWDTSSANYSNEATAACQHFARDERVEVVIDSVFGTIGGFSGCLQKAGILHLTSTTEGDRTSSRARPLHANPQIMVDDRTYTAVLQRLVGTGYLGKGSQLGIVLEQCPNDEAAYRNAIEPLIGSLKLRAPIVYRISCTTGFTSAGSAASAISNAVLTFRSAGVDRVMMMSDYETVALLLFGTAASSQGYRPGYLLSSNAQAEATRPSLPQDQWPQLHGVGVSPGGDVADAPLTAVEQRCQSMARAGGLQPETQNDRTYVNLQCGLLLLLDTALRSTDGVSTPSVLMAAITRLGTSFIAPAVAGGATSFGAARFDGPAKVRVFGYVSSCGCLRYSSPLLSAPS